MKYIDCFRALARHRTDELVVTSAGNSSQAWWAATRDIDGYCGSETSRIFEPCGFVTGKLLGAPMSSNCRATKLTSAWWRALVPGTLATSSHQRSAAMKLRA